MNESPQLSVLIALAMGSSRSEDEGIGDKLGPLTGTLLSKSCKLTHVQYRLLLFCTMQIRFLHQRFAYCERIPHVAALSVTGPGGLETVMSGTFDCAAYSTWHPIEYPR